LALVFAPAIARADENVKRLAYDTRIDAAVTVSGGGWWLAAELLKPMLVPEKCRWCYRRANGDSALNVVDRSVRSSLKWDNTSAADDASSVIAFIAMPITAATLPGVAAGYDNHLRYAPIDALLVAEASILAADLNQLVKYIFVRERPYAHFLPHVEGGILGLGESPSDSNLSFYSGHTTLAFALATSSGTIAFMRNYRLAPMVLSTQLAAAVSVGYLRIAADKHYLSDVMVGAVLGSLVGTLVPLIFHAPSAVQPTPTGTGTTGQGLGVAPAQAAFVF
jgi:membrane-associated phospholipid phosphatase